MDEIYQQAMRKRDIMSIGKFLPYLETIQGILT